MMNRSRFFPIMAIGYLLVALGSCQEEAPREEQTDVVALSPEQEAIVDRYLANEARLYPLYSQDRKDAVATFDQALVRYPQCLGAQYYTMYNLAYFGP